MSVRSKAANEACQRISAGKDPDAVLGDGFRMRSAERAWQFLESLPGGEVEGAKYLPAEAAYFRDIVSGVVREQMSLDPKIDAVLTRGWPLKRIEAVLRGVARGCL